MPIKTRLARENTAPFSLQAFTALPRRPYFMHFPLNTAQRQQFLSCCFNCTKKRQRKNTEKMLLHCSLLSSCCCRAENKWQIYVTWVVLTPQKSSGNKAAMQLLLHHILTCYHSFNSSKYTCFPLLGHRMPAAATTVLCLAVSSKVC